MQSAAVGLLAGALTTGAWLPQLHRTWRRRSAADISWPYLLTFGSGIVLWVAYGIADGDVALLAANVVTLVLLLCVIALKARSEGVRPSRRQPAVAGDARRGVRA